VLRPRSPTQHAKFEGRRSDRSYHLRVWCAWLGLGTSHRSHSGVMAGHGAGLLALTLLLLLGSSAGSASAIVELNEVNLHKITNGERWLIMWWAEWCGHCKGMMAELERVVPEKGFRVARLACHPRRYFCQYMNVDRFPTLMVVSGTQAWVHEGARNTEELTHFLHNMHAIRPPDRSIVFPGILEGLYFRLREEIDVIDYDIRYMQAIEPATLKAVCVVGVALGVLLAMLVYSLCCYRRCVVEGKQKQQ